MIDSYYRVRSPFHSLLICVFVIIVLTSCGSDDEVTPTSIPVPTSSPVPTETSTPTTTSDQTIVQPKSPLPLQSESPLLVQPDSPLPTPNSTPEGNTVSPNNATTRLSDLDQITELANATSPSEPEAGMASISGVLYSYRSLAIIDDVSYYLTPADESGDEISPPGVLMGPRKVNGDIAGNSNASGQMGLNNIPPGKYYLAVWTVYSWLFAYESQEAEIPLLITLKEGEKLNLGVIYVNWP